MIIFAHAAGVPCRSISVWAFHTRLQAWQASCVHIPVSTSLVSRSASPKRSSIPTRSRMLPILVTALAGNDRRGRCRGYSCARHQHPAADCRLPDTVYGITSNRHTNMATCRPPLPDRVASDGLYVSFRLNCSQDHGRLDEDWRRQLDAGQPGHSNLR